MFLHLSSASQSEVLSNHCPLFYGYLCYTLPSAKCHLIRALKPFKFSQSPRGGFSKNLSKEPGLEYFGRCLPIGRWLPASLSNLFPGLELNDSAISTSTHHKLSAGTLFLALSSKGTECLYTLQTFNTTELMFRSFFITQSLKSHNKPCVQPKTFSSSYFFGFLHQGEQDLTI